MPCPVSLRARAKRSRDDFPHCHPEYLCAWCITIADFSSSAASPPPDLNSRPFVLAVAQHQPNKRLDLLIAAFALVQRALENGQDLQLLVVGSEGARSESLRQQVTLLRLEDHVKWLPQLSDPQLSWMYQNCKVFVTSSNLEGFCLPLLEALMFECRIVASDIPVFREIAGDAPLYFDVSRTPVKNLAAAILQEFNAICSPSRRGTRFSRKYTAEECVALYSLLVPELIAVKDVEESLRHRPRSIASSMSEEALPSRDFEAVRQDDVDCLISE